MIITIFNKEIEIDENNKGIDFFLKEMCKPINETSVVYNYWQNLLFENDKATIEEAADKLRKMNNSELYEEIIDLIKVTLSDYSFSKDYVKYVC